MGFTPVLQDQPSFGVVQLVCQALQGVLLEYQFQPQVQLITDWLYHAVLLDVPGVDQEVLPPFCCKARGSARGIWGYFFMCLQCEENTAFSCEEFSSSGSISVFLFLLACLSVSKKYFFSVLWRREISMRWFRGVLHHSCTASSLNKFSSFSGTSSVFFSPALYSVRDLHTLPC